MRQARYDLRGAWAQASLLPLAMAFLYPPVSPAQQATEVMGAVALSDARVTGGLEVQEGVARLFTNASITAYDHDAAIALHRGGHVLVCSTSEFHLLHSGTAGALIFGLDRGAMEISTEEMLQDAVLTPDLKFVPVTRGSLDLRIRVTREGDTCINNAGAGAPVLNVTDPFSSASYRVLPGQHLTFVGGDLHKVVDHERSSCGCPSAASSRELAARTGKPPTAAQTAAAAAHPFPQAQSEGLSPAEPASNEAPVGTASSQVTTTFNYGEGQGRPPSVGDTPATAASSAPGATGSQESTAPEPGGGFFHAIGHFFHRLFGGR